METGRRSDIVEQHYHDELTGQACHNLRFDLPILILWRMHTEPEEEGHRSRCPSRHRQDMEQIYIQILRQKSQWRSQSPLRNLKPR